MSASDLNKKAAFQLNQWRDTYGDEVAARTQFVGHDASGYRKSVNLPPVHKDLQNKHNIFIHELGADVLRAKLDEEKQLEMEREALAKKQIKVTKLLRRKIKVTDLEDGGVSISMDQEWDTSTWNDELIQAGCEALILIFYDSSGNSSVERKERAVQMLQKLLYRHPSAELYVRKNIEMMIGKAANKLIRGGKCGGLLDLLYILHSCKESFLREMSQANFNGRAFEMLLQEARLAATIIQHAFRAQRNRKQLYKKSFSLVKHTGFGTVNDIRQSHMGVVNARSQELASKWRTMHCFHPRHVVSQIGGIRGPIHIGPVYTTLVLDIILTLVHTNALNFAQGNREDVVRADGCVLLTTFLAAPSGPFCRLSAAILSHLSAAWESFVPVITSGCIGSAFKSMHYLRTILHVGDTGLTTNRHERVSPQDAYLHCLDLVTNTATHAAGLYRACLGYRYYTPAHHSVENINYVQVLNILEKISYTKARLMDEAKLYLGNIKLLRELGAMLLYTSVPEILIKVLQCLLTILCTEAHDPLVVEITALQGTLMVKLGELVHHNNIEVGTYALGIFLQICCEHRSRQQLTRVQVDKMLLRRDIYVTKGGNGNSSVMMYAHPALHRNVLFTVALCRQCNWRYYDPTVLYNVLLGMLPFNSNASIDATDSTITNTNNTTNTKNNKGKNSPDKFVHYPDSVRHLLLLDLLRTMRIDNNISDHQAEQLSIADWVILPNNEPQCVAFSKTLHRYGAKAVVDFITHPSEPNYYEPLPLHESSAICVILENVASFVDTAVESYSVGTINFVAKYLYLCKYLFLGKRMLNSQILVLLNGIKSGVMALGRYAIACKQLCINSSEANTTPVKNPNAFKSTTIAPAVVYDTSLTDSYIHLMRDAECITTVLYFMNTLSIQHPKLESNTRALQVVVGTGCIDFLNMYAEMVIFAHKKSPVAKLTDLYPPAQAVIHLVQYLKTIHKKADVVVDIFQRACQYLYLITLTTEGGSICIQEYKIFDSMRVYLPTPLSGILPLEEKESNTFQHTNSLDALSEIQAAEVVQRQVRIDFYKVSLMKLPISFFLMCANLCKVDEGQALCFSEGYLRRALDRLNILNHRFIKNNLKYSKNKHSAEYLHFAEDVCGCMTFVTNSANYHHPRYGNANDLILNELYEFIPFCKNLICWELYTNKKRTDNFILCAYEALAALASDSYRVSRLIEKYDMLKVIREELFLLDSLPAPAARAAVLCVDRSVHGLTSKYIADYIPLLREPLCKVTRIYMQLGPVVRDCNWTLTRSAMLYKETVNPDYTVDEVIDIAMEQFVRTGTAKAHRRASEMVRASIIATTGTCTPGDASDSGGKGRHMPMRASVANMSTFAAAINTIREQNEAHLYSGTNTPLAPAHQGDHGGESNYEPFSPTKPALKTYHSQANLDTAPKRRQSIVDKVLLNHSPLKGSALHLTASPTLRTLHSLYPTNTKLETTQNTAEADLDYTVAYTPSSYTRPGTYLHCGVTTCGSLLTPCTHGHYSRSDMTVQQREQEILSLPFHDIDLNVCSVSKLSARGNELKRRIIENKSRQGFRDIKRHPSHYDTEMNLPPSTTVGVKSDASTSYASPVKAMKDISPPRMTSTLALKLPTETDTNNDYEQYGNNSVPFQRSPFKTSPLPNSGMNVIHKPVAVNQESKANVPAFSRGGSAKGISRAASNASISSMTEMKKSSNHTSNSISSADLRTLTSPALMDKQAKIREISLSDMPELILTRPSKKV